MYELGRARAIHACQRIVTLAAKGDWEIKNLPFDINHTVIPPVDIDNTDVFYHLIKKSVKFAYDSPETIFLHDDRVLYSDYQIQKNINSGKYLPNTFLEKRNLKEHLRFLRILISSHHILRTRYTVLTSIDSIVAKNMEQA